jgi:hypothetical protein
MKSGPCLTFAFDLFTFAFFYLAALAVAGTSDCSLLEER